MGLHIQRASGAPYRYEMHQHTAGCSACGIDDPVKTVKGLKAAGFAGMVLTNHFFRGNTGIRRHQDWVDFVRPYIDAYEQAKAVGQALDFDVLFGLEEGVGSGKEVLLYGISPQWALAYPELRGLKGDRQSLERLYQLVHEGGGLVYQAHPFRVRDYIADPWKPLPPDCLDGVEGYNASNSPVENVRAAAFAKEYDLPMIAGSDAHVADFRGRYGIACYHRIRTERDLADTLREQDYELYIPED